MNSSSVTNFEARYDLSNHSFIYSKTKIQHRLQLVRKHSCVSEIYYDLIDLTLQIKLTPEYKDPTFKDISTILPPETPLKHIEAYDENIILQYDITSWTQTTQQSDSNNTYTRAESCEIFNIYTNLLPYDITTSLNIQSHNPSCTVTFNTEQLQTTQLFDRLYQLFHYHIYDATVQTQTQQPIQSLTFTFPHPITPVTIRKQISELETEYIFNTFRNKQLSYNHSETQIQPITVLGLTDNEYKLHPEEQIHTLPFKKVPYTEKYGNSVIYSNNRISNKTPLQFGLGFTDSNTVYIVTKTEIPKNAYTRPSKQTHTLETSKIYRFRPYPIIQQKHFKLLPNNPVTTNI